MIGDYLLILWVYIDLPVSRPDINDYWSLFWMNEYSPPNLFVFLMLESFLMSDISLIEF